MARVLYFDCFSGISGDMVLGAFLDAGLPFDDLKRAGYEMGFAHVESGPLVRSSYHASDAV